MGFALWSDGEVACCAGTHEYRPMGVAVVASTDLFTARDFDPMRKPPPRGSCAFQGLFASLLDVNRHMARTRGRAPATAARAWDRGWP
jgi:hypothetical protein